MRHKYFIMHSCAFMHKKYLPLDVYIQQGVGVHKLHIPYTQIIWHTSNFGWKRDGFFRLEYYCDVIMSVVASQTTGCLLDRLFRRWPNKTSKLRVTGLCEGNGEFPAQRASNAENASFWWRHHESPIRVSFFKLGYEHGCSFWLGMGGRGTYTSKILKTYL